MAHIHHPYTWTYMLWYLECRRYWVQPNPSWPLIFGEIFNPFILYIINDIPFPNEIAHQHVIRSHSMVTQMLHRQYWIRPGKPLPTTTPKGFRGVYRFSRIVAVPIPIPVPPTPTQTNRLCWTRQARTATQHAWECCWKGGGAPMTVAVTMEWYPSTWLPRMGT